MVAPGILSLTDPGSPEAAAADLRYQRRAVYTLLAITVLRLVWLVGNPINLYPDEAQYWLWSRSPAFGYFSKPPLVPWIIAVTTAIFGEDEFAIRVASPLLHLATGLVVYAIARRLYDARVACWSAVLYATLPAVSLSAANGTARPFSLSLGSLWLSGGRRIEVPPQSFYVATLVTSDVVTVIGGQEVTRRTGDSWSVPSGASMVVQLQGRSEGALLDIFRVEPNPPAR